MGCDCEMESTDAKQKGVLIVLLAINGSMFILELMIGMIAQSTALIADAMDMFADATVYAIALLAVGRAIVHKQNAARLSGILQIFLGLGVIVEVVHRMLIGSEPESMFMIGVGLVALTANSICLMLISRHREGEIHMRASWIFSRNDVLANIGVILAGVLVAVLGNPLPDLIIGAIISTVVVSGGVRILREVRIERNGREKQN